MTAMDELADLDALCARLAGSPLLHDYEVLQLAPSDPPPIDLHAALASALAKPTGTPPLRDLARGRRTAAIITTDATRATPSAALIGPVMAELARGGIASDEVEVVIGVGAHRPATRDEIQRLLGAEWATRLRVTNHDARAGDLVAIGRTSRGVPLLLNRRVAEADLRIAFGQVEPHEFAGFTGGRKAILPSVAGYESIVRNHSLDMLASPAARAGVLQGNPIHEEMVEAARLVGLHFIVNVALDRELRPVALAAGGFEEAHAELVAFLRRHVGSSLPKRPPAVIVTGTGAPLDINLYQTIKALVGVEPLLDACGGGGDAPALVLLSRCWNGAGSEEMVEPFAQARERLAVAGAAPADASAIAAEVLRGLAHDYTIEKDEAYYIARATPKCSRVIACCPGVSEDTLRLFGWEAVSSADAAVARALELRPSAKREGRGQPPDEVPLVLLCPRPQRALFG